MLLHGITVVISPLVALMENQVESLVRRGFRAALLSSAQSKQNNAAVYADLKAMAPSTKLLYVTPELVDTPHFQERLARLYERNYIALFAVDEV